MEELRDKLLQNLSEINIRKDKINEGLKLSRDTYAAYQNKRRKKRVYSLSIVFSGLAAAVILGFIFIPSMVPLDTEQIFSENYQRFEFEVDNRGAVISDPLTLSAMLYKEGRYAEALGKLDSVLDKTPGEIRGILIKGLAELDGGDYRAAQSDLQQVAAVKGSLGMTAEWYLSLIDMRTGMYQSAADRLKLVKDDPDSPFSQKAAKLYHRLRYRANK